MLINTGGRTDIVQYYTPWLLNRFRAGYVLVRNPLFPSSVTRYALDPDTVDCVLFCSKNYAPILDHLHEITDRFHTFFYYTITAYDTDIEPGVPGIEDSIRTLIRLSETVGKERVVWRYSPILLNEKYTKTYVLETFRKITEQVSPYVNRCIFEFVDMYKKLQVNMPDLKAVSVTDRDDIAKAMGRIAAENHMKIQNCASADDYSAYGILPCGCIDLAGIGKANDIVFRPVKAKGMREHCHCAESHDIGAYNTCPNGCRYCYATWDFSEAARRYRHHDPSSEMLFGHLQPGDKVSQAKQVSWLLKNEQLSLF